MTADGVSAITAFRDRNLDGLDFDGAIVVDGGMDKGIGF